MASKIQLFELSSGYFLNLDQVVLVEELNPQTPGEFVRARSCNEGSDVEAVIVHTTADRPLDFLILKGSENKAFRKWVRGNLVK